MARWRFPRVSPWAAHGRRMPLTATSPAEEVTKVGDGSFTVKWEDPDGGPEESEVDPKDGGFSG